MGQIALFKYLEGQHVEKGALCVGPKGKTWEKLEGRAVVGCSLVSYEGKQNMATSSQQNRLLLRDRKMFPELSPEWDGN